MNRSELYAINVGGLAKNDHLNSWIQKQKAVPIAINSRIAVNGEHAVLKFRDSRGIQILEGRIAIHDNITLWCPDNILPDAYACTSLADLLVVAVHGVHQAISVIVTQVKKEEQLFSKFSAANPNIRLEAFNLPPHTITSVTTQEVAGALYRYMVDAEPELFSASAQKFLNSPHVLSELFSHCTILDKQDSIAFIDKTKIIADILRKSLAPYIHYIEKDHDSTWLKYEGKKVAFTDGGVSRIVSIPGAAPTGIRVGTYIVTPGDRDPLTREIWDLQPYVVGDVLSDRSLIEDDDAYVDDKRLIEAARYILEPLTILRLLDRQPVDCLLLHGPLQNAFETYAELPPYFIPGVSTQFLERHGLNRSVIENAIKDIPTNKEGKRVWNSCIPVYATIQKLLEECKVPICGIVERGASTLVTRASLEFLVDRKEINESARRKILAEVKRFDLSDELIFGCVLRAGEYLTPFRTRKNFSNRSIPRWQGVIGQMPPVFTTIIKTSEYSYPFRIEYLGNREEEKMFDIMQLIYHTSLLLPSYAFPVGIDIADKFAKIPDWMSKGVSATLAASIFRKCLQVGDPELLNQMRNRLTRSPRDFFYRPITR